MGECPMNLQPGIPQALRARSNRAFRAVRQRHHRTSPEPAHEQSPRTAARTPSMCLPAVQPGAQRSAPPPPPGSPHATAEPAQPRNDGTTTLTRPTRTIRSLFQSSSTTKQWPKPPLECGTTTRTTTRLPRLDAAQRRVATEASPPECLGHYWGTRLPRSHASLVPKPRMCRGFRRCAREDSNL